MDNGVNLDDIFDTIINPDVEEEEERIKKKERKEKRKQINYKEEYEEAQVKLQGLYNFDKYLKLDIPTRLMSIYGVGIDKFNSFRFGHGNWYEIRYKHICFTIKEDWDFKTREKILILDSIYRLYDDKGSFIKFETYSK